MVEGATMATAVCILGLIFEMIFFGWRHINIGNNNGKKYLLCTPPIKSAPTGEYER